MIECAGLEIRYTPFGYRGFESLIFRQGHTIEVLPLFHAIAFQEDILKRHQATFSTQKNKTTTKEDTMTTQRNETTVYEERTERKRVKKRLLFVCLGNICRSPAAEGVMRHLVNEAGEEEFFEIDSAGIGGWHVGQLPDKRMRQCGSRRGYHFESRARQFSPTDFDRFDRILVMDADNLRAITAQARTAEDAKKVEILARYLVRRKDVCAIPDPYYGDERDFDYALDLIEEATAHLLETLSRSSKN